MNKEISVLIPVYNEEETVTILYEELTQVLNSLNKHYEIIFVDDGSTDKTAERLREISIKDSSVKIITFQRNYGKAAGLSAGFTEATGEIIITMDGDLQDDPKEIPRFIDKINEGYDLVSGWKTKRRDPITKTLPSKVFNYLTRIVTGIKIHDSNCGYKAYKLVVAKKVNIYGELHRYIPSIAHWMGYKIGEITVEHRPRTHGKSKYGVRRLLSGFLDLITIKYLNTFKKKPLHLFGLIGVICIFIGGSSITYLAYIKFVHGATIGPRPLLYLGGLLIIMGIQFFGIGLIGETITSDSKKAEYTKK